MVYGLPWLDKTAIKWSTGDKMVYRLPWLDKTAIKWSTGDKMVYGLPSLDNWPAADKLSQCKNCHRSSKVGKNLVVLLLSGLGQR